MQPEILRSELTYCSKGRKDKSAPLKKIQQLSFCHENRHVSFTWFTFTTEGCLVHIHCPSTLSVWIQSQQCILWAHGCELHSTRPPLVMWQASAPRSTFHRWMGSSPTQMEEPFKALVKREKNKQKKTRHLLRCSSGMQAKNFGEKVKMLPIVH